jgi:cytochrome c biogenesis protein CcmG/thiol:disulfide interchange protein DsbE
MIVKALRWLALASVVGLFGLLVWKVTQPNPGQEFLDRIESGQRPVSPRFDLKVVEPGDAGLAGPRLRRAMEEGRVTQADLHGRPAVVNFWASWCYPCKEEAPVLAEGARRHAGKITFVGIDYQDFTQDARRFVRRYDLPFLILRDGDGSQSRRWGITAVPETYFLDLHGRVVYRSIGRLTSEELESGLRRATTPE